MFRGGFGLSTEALRRREAQAAARPPSKRSGEEEGDSEDEKTAQAKALISSSAEKDRKPDVFDTHVGPFLESYVLWCQKKGVILGWIPGLVGVALFILVALAVGTSHGHRHLSAKRAQPVSPNPTFASHPLTPPPLALPRAFLPQGLAPATSLARPSFGC